MSLLAKIMYKLKKIMKSEITDNSRAFYTKDYYTNKSFVIGEHTYGKPQVLFENEDANLFIGKYCSIANHVTIFLGGNHRTDWISTYPFSDISAYPEAKTIVGHPATKGNVTIENDVWIGYGSMILSGVHIHTGAVIAAGSVVTKDVGPYEIWGGNPCRFIKKRFSETQIAELLESKWWDKSDAEVRKLIPKLCNQLKEDEKIFL